MVDEWVKHIAKDNRVCVLCGSYCYIVDLLFSVFRLPFHNVAKASISQMIIFSEVTKKKTWLVVIKCSNKNTNKVSECALT